MTKERLKERSLVIYNMYTFQALKCHDGTLLFAIGFYSRLETLLASSVARLALTVCKLLVTALLETLLFAEHHLKLLCIQYLGKRAIVLLLNIKSLLSCIHACLDISFYLGIAQFLATSNVWTACCHLRKILLI